MANLVNAESLTLAFGTRILLDGVSLGLNSGDVVGVVGRNGDGKTTLLRLLVGTIEPDSGRVVRNASIGYLGQGDDFLAGASVRDVIVSGRPDHVWAADASRREVVTNLLTDIDLERPVAELSGGERRRAALASVLLGGHDLLVLDEPTNHLDVEAISWLAEHLNHRQQAGVAMLVVSHDRWFLDAVCTRVWEVHDAVVDAYDGGYAAYVLARAERVRQAAANEARRQNLLRKELAWLRRGPPARTSKPKFRIDAANVLIRDVPEARDTIRLREFATSRLGKDVFDLKSVSYAVPAAGRRPGDSGQSRSRVEPGMTTEGTSSAAPPSPAAPTPAAPPTPVIPANAGIAAAGGPDDRRVLLDHVDWSIGPGDRIGIIGVNGSGKTTVLRLLSGDLHPASGKVKQGKTLRLGELSQDVTHVRSGQEALDESERVLDSVQRLQRQVRLATGVESSTSSLLEDFGFRGDRLVTRIGELSGGERRRLQFLRLLLTEPNVLLLDEPTNDLDIDTLTVIEDYLDTWPGTLVVVSHDRYFLERTCDAIYALTGDGKCVLLPGGVEEYLERRRRRSLPEPVEGSSRRAARPSASDAAAERQARKDLARVEGQLAKQATRVEELHALMSEQAADYERLVGLETELKTALARQDELENAWLDLAEQVGEG